MKLVVTLTYETVVEVPDDLPEGERFKAAGKIADEFEEWIRISSGNIDYNCKYVYAEILG